MKKPLRSYRLSLAGVCLSAALSLLQLGCGPGALPGTGSNAVKRAACTPPPPSDSLPGGPSVHVKHVFIVVLENHAYDDVMGNTQDMPYLNSLAQQYAYAKGYYANTHPSIGNYFWLTTGQTITQDDAYSSTVTADNIVRTIISAGMTWKEYSESLPSVGYVGGDVGEYIEHHDPLSYFSDVRDSAAELTNLVPFTQLAVDIGAHSLPNYGFIVPNGVDDAHDCPSGQSGCTMDTKLADADSWLQANISPLLQSSDFNSPGGGLLIITFDESFESDTVMGGGRVAWVLVGPDVKKGYTSTSCFQHESTLRFMAGVVGLTNFPGAATTAPDMREFLIGD